MNLPLLPESDLAHIRAVQGWIELGNHLEATAELEEAPAMADRWDACVDVGWAITAQDPGSITGWRQLAEALHKTGKSGKAVEMLRPQTQRHRRNAIILYDLARFHVGAGDLDQAGHVLFAAIALDDDEAMTEKARMDPDLKDVFARISGQG